MAYAAISKPSLHFNTKLYTGDGASPRSITGVGFQPDFLWIKNRSGGTAYEHRLMDAVRGSNKVVHSSGSGAESSEEYYTVGSFDSDGWTGRNGTGSNQVITGGNDNGYNFAAWNWKANGQGSSNTAGTINTTYTSANTTAGFSIITYTGNGTANATIGHGLGVEPAMILFKRTDTSNNWIVYHKKVGTGDYLTLNSQGSSDSASGAWCTPSSTLIQLNQVFGATNTNGANYVAYCFAEKQGYSKFGSYGGNSNADGTFVYTGFKPAFINIKASSRQESWYMFDNKRVGRNPDNEQLYSDANSTEATTDYLDILSNGFKLRQNNVGLNGSGETYVYMAFAAEPLVANVGQSIPATAR